MLSEGLATAGGTCEWERLQDCRLDANVNIIIIIIVSSFQPLSSASRPRRQSHTQGQVALGCLLGTGSGARPEACFLGDGLGVASSYRRGDAGATRAAGTRGRGRALIQVLPHSGFCQRQDVGHLSLPFLVTSSTSQRVAVRNTLV